MHYPQAKIFFETANQMEEEKGDLDQFFVNIFVLENILD